MSEVKANGNLAPGQSIPPPDDFPVKWENPDGQDRFWTFNNMHYPDFMAPLTYEVMDRVYGKGLNETAEILALPIRVHQRHVNGYLYQAIVPEGAPPEPVIKVMNQVKRVLPGVVNAIESKAVGAATDKYMAKMNPIIDRLGDYWEQELLPEVKEHLAAWEQFDLDGASTPELLDHWEETLARGERIGVIHFLIGFPMLLAMSQFDELYVDLFGDEDGFGSYSLLQGFDNKILEGDRALWNLGRKALTMPAVQRVLEEEAAADVMPALEETADGQIFLQELRAFLQEYGQRADKFSTVGEVTWIEDPRPVIKNLKDYVTQPDRDVEAELAAEADARERRLAQVRRRLQGYPQAVRDEFERLLEAAQAATVAHADHGYWIDFRALYQIRRVVQAFGRRFADAGVIAAAEDVFYLTAEEVRETASSLPELDRKKLVARRRARLDPFRDVQPPRALGTVPLAPPPDDPFARALTKFFGNMPGTPPQAPEEPGTVQGKCGSPGKVQGPAKVIRALAEASKLEPGDVLVAETTAPPWTPLFATAAAVVTDTGGVLSHCAVVAREYRIPAVVGTGLATGTFEDGQLVEVDGDAGVARRV